MTKPSFIYATYIATTADKVWQALVDADIARVYWRDPTGEGAAHVNVSDWQKGSRWEHQRDDAEGTVDIVGTVIESLPPSRLVLTWARPQDEADAAKHSRVTFEIVPEGAAMVRLTVTHEDLEDDPKMLSSISGGWPKILSNLKTLLETGHVL